MVLTLPNRRLESSFYTATEKKKPALSRLEQARAERALKAGGPAANKLAALLNAAPTSPNVSDSDDDAPPPTAKKKK